MSDVKVPLIAEPPFLSIQGEGSRTGKPVVFIRFFGCNLNCKGFGQPDPADPSTYIPCEITTLEKSPAYGCDSPKAVQPQFKHLCAKYDSTEQFVDYLLSRFRIDDLSELVITGGEPMLHQDFIINLIEVLHQKTGCGYPQHITIETNGSIAPTEDFIEYFKECNPEHTELLFSVSPKLNCVAGVNEKVSINIKSLYSIVFHYNFHGLWDYQLKFVFNGDVRAENRIDQILDEIEQLVDGENEVSIDRTKVLLMPVGAHQTLPELRVKTAETCLKKHFSYCARVHVDIWGAKTGC